MRRITIVTLSWLNEKDWSLLPIMTSKFSKIKRVKARITAHTELKGPPEAIMTEASINVHNELKGPLEAQMTEASIATHPQLKGPQDAMMTEASITMHNELKGPPGAKMTEASITTHPQLKRPPGAMMTEVPDNNLLPSEPPSLSWGNSGDVIQGCAVGVRRIVAQGARYIKSIHIDPYSCIMILAHEKQT